MARSALQPEPTAPEENTMPRLLGSLSTVLLATSLAAAADGKSAAPPAPPPPKECSARGSERKLPGDARPAFPAECLEGSAPARRAEPASQGEKMRTCSKEASTKALKGDDRKTFMSECLRAVGKP
jgi:hypothetical protein